MVAWRPSGTAVSFAYSLAPIRTQVRYIQLSTLNSQLFEVLCDAAADLEEGDFTDLGVVLDLEQALLGIQE